MLALISRLLGITDETAVGHVRPIDRKYVWTYILDEVGPLKKSEVKDLAIAIHGNAHADAPQPLLKVLRDSIGRGPSKDPFLEHVAINYTDDELTEPESPSEVLPPGSAPRRLIDLITGVGPAKPVLKELYSLRALGEVETERDAGGDEQFLVSGPGQLYAKSLRTTYRNLALPDDFVLELGPVGARKCYREVSAVKTAGD